MSNEKCAIGIDLGTTYSCVAVWEHGKVVIIPNELGNRTTPSVVAFTDTERFVGEAAKNQAGVNPKNTVFDAKRIIGRYFDDPNIQSDMKYWPFQVICDRGKPNIQVEFKGQLKAFAPEEISAMVLSKLKESAETYLGNPVKDAVITVPAYFNDSQRQATIDAGTIAGLNVLRIINEPTAAAIAYGLDKNLKGTRNVFIFDLGGGTFDVSIVTIHEGSRFQVRATSGNTHLGGGDFDNRLLEFLMKELNKKHNKNLNSNLRVLNKIRIRSEQIKRTLSSITEDTINVEIEDQDYSLKITRARFEELCLDLFCNTIDISEKAMKDAGVDEHSIDDIVLVGGSTRIPEVKRLLQKLFSNHTLNQSINPDEAVAYGAAVEAAILTGNKNPIIQDLVLQDVIPLSLGTAIEGKIMSFILMRNTTFPCKVTKPYTTVNDNQTEILFRIFEGERPLVKGNNLLGSFNLSGIPPQPRGMAIVDVTFDMDINGILVASATCRHSGNSSNITIKNDRGRLTKDETFRMIREAEMYKKDDDMERDRITARNELEKCIYSMRRSTTTAGGALSKNKKRMLIAKSHQAEKWLESNSLANKGMIQHQLKELQDLLASIVI